VLSSPSFLTMDILNLTKSELAELIKENTEKTDPGLLSAAYDTRVENYGKKVYFRGLIEFTNYCKNNCYYCGIRSKNKNAERYRLSKEQIMDCCKTGRELGFSTFVLQGGEDAYFTDKRMCEIIYSIKSAYPDCAVTLSIGEKSRETYQAYKSAGADRYLLRHETADNEHYGKLHPSELSLENRKKCLYTLRELGFQTGAGFMVGSPYQSAETLAEDMLFLKDLQPHMVGIGPFIPQKDSIFANEPHGTLELTVTMLALTRLMLPKVLLPATTALATICEDGRNRAFEAGANVVMPNLSPKDVRKNYNLYNNKKSSGDEAAQGLDLLKKIVENAGLEPDMSRGDSRMERTF